MGDTGGSGELGESELRLLLHEAVGDLRPSTGALDHLRRAVPARRRRRRQVLVGAAVAVVLCGAALPALVHVATRGGADDRQANAASSGSASEAADGPRGATGGGGPTAVATVTPSGQSPGDKGTAGKKGERSQEARPGADGAAPAASGSLSIADASCARSQLGDATASVGAADAEGRIYGSFLVRNISDRVCSVLDDGAVYAVAQGGADASRVTVTEHTAGDAATGLDDPGTEADGVVLRPGEAYKVAFAWIPAAGGGTGGCANPGSSPTPDPTQDPGNAPDSGSGAGAAGGGSGGGAPSDASVVVSHVPAAGDPVAASATLPGACAGTVYRTGARAAS
ncbi:hypothetical protein RKE29_03990 [Streptomyces sp. B1866]|uniref:hypothetical protein n=1 Tax=Streptomyces sp. B1866 TaxID=3075431 RepID=UPI0028912AFC|nr:hypothetical protein [Streptomyces sp. B1866]MDT3395812.1 hypothetical protein [Streptomyces sp. B1866]